MAPKYRQLLELLNNLLLIEYQQRDVYETYSYYLFGLSSPGIQEHLEEHRKEEDEHIKTLQRYLAALDAEPLLKRLEIPTINPPIKNILKEDLRLERDAIKYYSDAIAEIEKIVENGEREFTALRVDLENILVQEQEHVHDLIQWLRKE